MAPHAGTAHGWYAGSIKQRLGDLQNALNDEKVRAIWCSRGGYGAVHLLEQLDFTRFREHPKWIIGYSDITALHSAAQLNGVVSLHAPMARHLTVEADDDEATALLHDTLFGTLPAYTIATHKLNRKGTAVGTLRGGNLSVLQGLRGTPYDIPAEGTILFLEDVGERPHSIERMMYNLRLGGVLERLSGLVIGQFTEYEENLSLGKELYAALAEVVKSYTFPVCFNFPVGHVTHNVPLLCGAEVRLEVGTRETKLNFNPPQQHNSDEE
jgi:muramoyltetrapeptide carboxypeptidase